MDRIQKPLAARHSQSKHARIWRRRVAVVLIGFSLAVASMFVSSPTLAAPPPDFQTSLVVGDGLNQPSGMEIAPDGRIFVLERGGKIKVVKNGQLLPQPFADLPSQTTGDRGLIGVAFDPEFGVANHYVYFYYTGADLLNHLVRFSADTDIGTEGPYELFHTTSPSELLHVGGSIRFGPDGKLYFAVGDNGNGDLSQLLSNPHGKILRINKDGTVPPDNPFYGQPGVLESIWAYGFRNPWRFQFDPATGEMYGGDVGNYTWEELNHIVKGGNYGWPRAEGVCTANCTGFIDPIYAYNHDNTSSAVTGGPIYRAGMFPPEYQGNLFFADYARGFIKRAVLNPDGSVAAVHDFDTTGGSVTDMKVAPDGSMYYITYWPGALYRVTYNTTSHVPVANATADVTKGVQPLTTHFSSNGSNDPDGDPLSFLWDFGDGTTSTDPNPTKTYANVGVYTARLTVTANGDSTIAQPIVIQVGVPPTLTVSTPTEGQLYRAGDTITYNAFASDGAGFDLNDAGISTVVRLHHGTHFHPFVGPLIGRSNAFTIPTTGEASADTSYELTVTATDANGLSTSKVVTVRPRTSTLTIATSPPGLGLQLDGIPITGPFVTEGVSGFKRSLVAPTTATASDGTPLMFGGWSDGNPIRHTITTSDTDTTWTANYVPNLPFSAEYYDNQDLAGTPVLTRQDQDIEFNWGDGSPAPSIPNNFFSARWTKKQWFGAGRYTFSATTDDGARLYIDNRRVMDEWFGQANVEHTYTADLGEGEHTIRFEFREGGGGARASLHWAGTPDQPSLAFHAEYWNLTPTGGAPSIPGGPPDLVREEPVIDNDWGYGSPAASVHTDLFAARWTRTLNLAPGQYEFTATSDDGVRLIIDGAPVIDKWIYQGPTSYTVQLPMDGAAHSFVMEYFEHGGGAVAKLRIRRLASLPDPQPYQAQYWNNPAGGGNPAIPTSTPDLARAEEEIDHSWYDGPLAPALNSDNVIARYTRTDVLSAGTYRFSGNADDGLRVYVDNVPVVDMWHLQHTNYSVDKVLGSGEHSIRVEYFEANGYANVAMSYDRIGDVRPDDGYFTGEYFANPTLTGPAALTRQDPGVDFDFGAGSPAAEIPSNNFSARWTKTVSVPAGNYKFSTTTDDGVRLYVDGTQLIDKWVPQGPTTHTAVVALTEGQHEIKMEYLELGGGALAKLSYAPTTEQPPPPPPPANPFAAQYFANTTLDGEPVVSRSESAVDYDWGQGSPDPAVPTNGFSARWTKVKDYAGGQYRFTVTGDDGIRLLIDGNQVLDGWHDQGPTTYSADVTLAAGSHTLVVEYYERSGGATARFTEAAL